MSGKKKSKPKAAVIIICLLLVLAGVGAILWMAWTMPVEEAQALVETIRVFAVEKVVPIGTAVLAAVVVILAMISPEVTRVKTAADRFDGASDAIDAEQTESVKTRQCIEEYKKEQSKRLEEVLSVMDAKLEARLAEMQDRIEGACAKVEGVSGRVDEIAERQDAAMQVQLIETQNRADLVRSGHAEQIERIAGRYRRGGDGHE